MGTAILQRQSESNMKTTELFRQTYRLATGEAEWRSPWQNPYVERLTGSIRRDCLNHVVVLNDRHLKRILASYFDYYHRWRTHLSLMMDSPDSRPVQAPSRGRVVQFPEVGSLHHHYERRAA